MSRKIRIFLICLVLVLTIINVGAPPGDTRPRIGNIDIGNVTDTSAKIIFTVDQEDAKTKIDYGKGASLDQISWNNDTGLTRTIILSDLSADTDYRFRVYAHNGNDSSLSRQSSIERFKTAATTVTPIQTAKQTTNGATTDGAIPTIINTTIKVEGITSSTANITFSVDQDDARTMVQYGETESLGDQSNPNDDLSSRRKIMLSDLLDNTKYYFSVYAYNKSDGRFSNSAIDSFTTEVYIPRQETTYGTGNRIWDESKDMNTNYIWNSFSFAGFYYDIDNNISTEELKIKNIKRTINEGDVTYTTSPIEVDFGYSNFGQYQVIGFMADKYFAGYIGNSAVSSNKEINVIGRGQLQKILIDDDNKRTISEGSTLTLKEGYVLKMKEVDIGAGKGQIWISLLKEGNEVDNDVVAAGDNYVYTKRIGSIDLPIIAIHFDTVFRGKETNAAFIKGVFQISGSYTSINNNNRYGKMEISEINKDRIIMINRDTIDLSAGNTINLMGDLKIIVADSSKLRFALSVERTGEFEARGTIYPVTREWTPMNFGLNIGNKDVGYKNIGFYYNLNEDIGTEHLRIESISGTSIPEGGLIYSTSPQEVSFDYSDFGKYQVIGFMADKYFAGYTGNSAVSSNKIINTISSGQLHKIIFDDESKHTVSEGGTLTLGEGYVLKMKEVDVGAGTGQIWISLLKDGNEIDNDVVTGRNNYVYSKKIGRVDNLPIIAIHFDSVFRGREVNAAFVRGIFQISGSYISLDSNSRYGKMEVSTINSNKITMENKDTISLSSGNIVDVMGDIKFKTANSGDLRFYPFVLVTENMVVNQLKINIPIKATAGETIKINVTAGGISVEGVSIDINPEIGSINGSTNKDGMINFTFPITSRGTYKIIATKLGYQEVNKSIEIEKVDRKLGIDIPAIVDQFRMVPIKVTYNNTAINNVTITFDNNTIGTTNDNGTLNYKLESSGNHIISASKDGYITISREINIRAPYSEFKAQNINILPNKTFKNGKVLIISNMTNIGTKADTKSIELIIDNKSVSNQSITLTPDEIRQINFTYMIIMSEGNYTVEILGQKELLEVQKAPLNIVFIGAIITIIGAIIIYGMTSKDKKNILSIIKDRNR